MPHLTQLMIQRDQQGLFIRIESTASALGAYCELEIRDAMETLHLFHPNGSHLFWIAPWDNEWVVCLHGPRLYRVDVGEDIDRLVADVIHTAVAGQAGKAALRDAFQSDHIREMSYLEWSQAKRTRVREELARMGWKELGEAESQQAWMRLADVDQTAADQTAAAQSCATWDISHVCHAREEPDRRFELLIDFHQKLLKAMRKVNTDAWLAIEFNHPCYRLATREMSETLYPWPVSPFPDHDEGYFVTSNFGCGILPQLRQSITLFGQPLLDSLAEDLPLMLMGKQIPRSSSHGSE